jgi:hypothetical protein
VKLATVVWIGYGPFYVADALDLYKKYNLKVSLHEEGKDKYRGDRWINRDIPGSEGIKWDGQVK